MFSVPKEKVILLGPFPGIVFYNSLADRIKKKSVMFSVVVSTGN